MKSFLLSGILVMALAGPAAAEEECFVSMADWQPRDAVVRLAEQHGWTVRRIKIDDGCYKVTGQDTDGHEIEVTVHPSTLEIVGVETESTNDEGKEQDAHND